MNSDDRRLCIDFLVRVARRSKGDAKRHFGTLGGPKLDQLLEHASEWRSLGFPTKDAAGNWQVSSQDVAMPAELVMPIDADSDSGATQQLLPVDATASPSRQKKTMFSILLPPRDLESLRGLADETGETVAYHVREAIRRYLKASQMGQL